MAPGEGSAARVPGMKVVDREWLRGGPRQGQRLEGRWAKRAGAAALVGDDGRAEPRSGRLEAAVSYVQAGLRGGRTRD